MKWIHRFFVLATLLCFMSSRSQAHANLAESDPPPNAVLALAPDLIQLRFTEPIETTFSQITLQTASDERIAEAYQTDEQDASRVTLPVPALSDGVYTVVWRVVSAADGHSSEGSYAFIVGSGAALANAVPASQPINFIHSLIRALNFFSMAALLGGIAFYQWILRPIGTPDAVLGRLRVWLVGAGGLVLLSLLLLFLMQTELLTGQAWPAENLFAIWGQIAFQTRFGGLWLLRVLCLLVIGVALWRGYPLWIALLVGLLLLGSQSLFSHSAAHDWLWLNDWVHSIAAALWIGGVLAFLAVIPLLWREEGGIARISHLTARFSNLGRLSVASLAVTGGLAAFYLVGSLEALVNTTYGQALLIKLGFLLPLLAAAAINLIWTGRNLKAGKALWAGRLFGLLVVEFISMTVILLAVGVMTSVNPAQEAYAQVQAPAPTVLEVEQGVFRVQLHIDPVQIGLSTFSVNVTDLNGEPITSLERVRMRFENLTSPKGRIELPSITSGAGEFTAQGIAFTDAGEWRIRLTLQQSGMFDQVVDFSVVVE